jgi:RecB family endonuclease NucS
MKSEHNTLVDLLEKDLRDRYRLIMKEVYYPNKNHPTGCVDLIGVVDMDLWHIIEVKANHCTRNEQKAYDQLLKACLYINQYCVQKVRGVYIATYNNKIISKVLI